MGGDGRLRWYGWVWWWHGWYDESIFDANDATMDANSTNGCHGISIHYANDRNERTNNWNEHVYDIKYDYASWTSGWSSSWNCTTTNRKNWTTGSTNGTNESRGDRNGKEANAYTQMGHWFVGMCRDCVLDTSLYTSG